MRNQTAHACPGPLLGSTSDTLRGFIFCLFVVCVSSCGSSGLLYTCLRCCVVLLLVLTWLVNMRHRKYNGDQRHCSRLCVIVLCCVCVCVRATMKKWVQCFDHTCVEAVMVRCAPVTMRSTAKARREETCTWCPMQASTMAVNRNVSAFTTVATVPIEVPARLSPKNTDPH